MEPAGAKMTSGGGAGGERGGGVGGDAKKVRVHASHDLLPSIDAEESDRLEGLDDQGQEPLGGLSEESQSARVAVSPPMTPQQPYIQYQHSSYPPYLAMCESGGGSYRGVSPTLVHNYPGKTLSLTFQKINTTFMTDTMPMLNVLKYYFTICEISYWCCNLKLKCGTSVSLVRVIT